MEKTKKLHYHRLEPFSDNRHHHYYCTIMHCGREFWSDEILDSMIQDTYEGGYDEGFKDSKNPKILICWVKEKFQQYLRMRKVIKYNHEERRKN